MNYYANNWTLIELLYNSYSIHELQVANWLSKGHFPFYSTPKIEI